MVVKKKPGFTLVEMLIVISVLGILAALVYPYVAVGKEEAQASAASSTLESLRKQISLYHAERGAFPTGIPNDWFAGGKKPTNPFSGEQVATVEVETSKDAARTEPADKIVTAGTPPIWYNPANGAVRMRVNSQKTAAETVALYNRINGSQISALNQSGAANQPQQGQ